MLVLERNRTFVKSDKDEDCVEKLMAGLAEVDDCQLINYNSGLKGRKNRWKLHDCT